MDSFSDRRGATAVCNVETYPQPCISNGPEKYCPVCLDQQQSLARPPRSGPSISKFFLPGNILLCVTEVFKPQYDKETEVNQKTAYHKKYVVTDLVANHPKFFVTPSTETWDLLPHGLEPELAL